MLVLCFILLFIATANAVTNQEYINLVVNDPHAAGLVNSDGHFYHTFGTKDLDNDSSRQFYYSVNTSASPRCIGRIEIKQAGWVENASILDPLLFESKPHLCLEVFVIVSTKLTGSLSNNALPSTNTLRFINILDNEFIDTYPDKLMNSLSNPVGCGIEVKHNPNLQGTLGALLPSCIMRFEINSNPKLTGTLPEVPPLSVALTEGISVTDNGLTGEITFSFLNEFSKQTQRNKGIGLSGNKFTSLPDKYATLPLDVYYFIDISDNCLAGTYFGSVPGKSINNNMLIIFNDIMALGKSLNELDTENVDNDNYKMKATKAKCSNSRDTFNRNELYNSVKEDNGKHCSPNDSARAYCDENNKIIGLSITWVKDLPNDFFVSLPHLKSIVLRDTNIPTIPSGIEHIQILNIVSDDVSDIDFTQFINLKELVLHATSVNWSNIIYSNNFVNMESLSLECGSYDFQKAHSDSITPLPNLRNMGTYPKLTSFRLLHNHIFNDEAIEASGMQVSDVENLYYQEGANYFDRNFNTFPANKFPSLQSVFVGGPLYQIRTKITFNGNDFQITIPPIDIDQYIVFPSDSNVNLGDIISNINAENPDTNPLVSCNGRRRRRHFQIALHCPLSYAVSTLNDWEDHYSNAICFPNEDLIYDGKVACVPDKPCLLYPTRATLPDEVQVSGDANNVCSESFSSESTATIFKNYKYAFVRNPSSNSHGAITISGTLSGNSASNEAEPVSNNPCDNDNPCLNGGICRYNANNDKQRCECTLKWYGKTCALQAKTIKRNQLPAPFRQFLTNSQVPLKNIVRDSEWADYDDKMMRQVRKTAMNLINYYKVPGTIADDWSTTKLRKFGNKIVNMMNRNGRFILTSDNIAVQFNRVYTGSRRLLQSDGSELQATISYNSSDDSEVLAVMEDSSSGIDTTELVTELNQDADFDITGDIEETVSLEESEVVVIDYVDNYDGLSDTQLSTYEPTQPNNANDPEGNGYEPTTKARIIGNIKRRRNPYDGEAKSIDEVQNMVRDLISNNEKRKQWPLAKKIAFAKKSNKNI